MPVSAAKMKIIISDDVASSGISEPMPVAATFFTPDAAGRSLSAFAAIDTMVLSTPY